MSGETSSWSHPNQAPVRPKPVITSSTIKQDPLAVADLPQAPQVTGAAARSPRRSRRRARRSPPPPARHRALRSVPRAASPRQTGQLSGSQGTPAGAAVGVRGRDLDDVGGLDAEFGVVGRQPRRGRGHPGETVVAAVVGEDDRLLRLPAADPVAPRQLDRGLVGLAAAADEEDAAEAGGGQPGDPLGQLDRRRRGDAAEGGRVGQRSASARWRPRPDPPCRAPGSPSTTPPSRRSAAGRPR